MIPSANPTPHPAAQAWSDLGRVPAASCSGLESRYSRSGRQQDWDWDNAMLLAQHSAHGCINEPEADFKPSIMQAEAIAGPTSNSFQYDGLLSTGVNSSGLNLPGNTWNLLCSAGVRNSGGLHENSSPAFQASSTPYYGSLGATGINGCTTGTGLSLYGDPRSTILGLVNLDQRRLQDLTKREAYTMADFNSRIGLNLGVRTYFSTDDYGFGRFGRRPRPNSPGAQAPLCQAEGCKSDLSIAKHYHRRHKVCEFHSKAATVIITGKTQRFCQQCSRFHVLSEFDDGKRSCRKRLADHNRRRRKPQLSPTAAANSTAAQAADQKNETEKTTASEAIRDGGHSNDSPATSLPLSLVSAIPLATPVSQVTQEAKQQVTIFSENTDQEVGQNYGQGCLNGGPSLSLTSLGRGTHAATSQSQATEETIYEGMDVSVPWLRPGNSRSSNTDTAVGTRSSSSSMAHMQKANLSSSQDVSSSIQILLPLQMSSDEHIENSSSDWVMKARVQGGNEKLDALNSSTLSGIRGLDDKDENITSQRSQQTITNHTLGISEQTLSSSSGLNGVSDNQLVTGNRLGFKLSGLQELNPLNRSIYSSNPMV